MHQYIRAYVLEQLSYDPNTLDETALLVIKMA